ncbi:MAG: hypothetical protein KDD32_03190 [Bacteroidetes bacterium]|nr:hypothetical protein [Bacteroidota bacterium]
MKKLNYNLFMVLALVFSVTLITSCGEDGCTQEDFVDTFVGKYRLAGLFELTNNDTAIITSNGSTLAIQSALLGTTFNAQFDESTRTGLVSNLTFAQFVIGGDTLFDISVQSGVVELDNSCDRLYVTLSGVSVASGTVDLPDFLHTPSKPDGYPLENVGMDTKNGLIRLN